MLPDSNYIGQGLSPGEDLSRGGISEIHQTWGYCQTQMKFSNITTYSFHFTLNYH